MRLALFRVCAAVAVTSLACSPILAARQAPECRTFTTEEVRNGRGPGAGTITQNCRFDVEVTSKICNMRTRLGATAFDVTYTDKYNSVEDFIDEVRVVPPIARIQKQSRRYTSGSGPNAELAYEYDGARRQTRLSTNMAGNLLVATYSTWDPKGRPTAAIVSSKASTINLQYRYDDAERTMTTMGPAGNQIDTYDADGNMIRSSSTDGVGTTIFEFKINKTEKICKPK